MKVEIDGTAFEIPLLPFRSEGNKEYVLVDTSCVLGLLKRLQAVFYSIEKRELKLAILETTVCEVAEHLRKSKNSLLENNLPAFHIDNAVQNLRKLLQDERVKKVANPAIDSDKQLSNYTHFGEDAILAYTLYKGNFKAIATKDGPLSKRLEGERCVPCNLLFKNQS